MLGVRETKPARRRVAIVVTLAASAVLAGVIAPGTPPAHAGPSLPQPDVAYTYAQLDFMSSNYLQRYSGQDGPPGDLNPADGNQPAQTNGWQEFFAHWKQQVTSSAVMGPLTSNLRVDDHLFRAGSASFFGPQPPFDSNDVTVTIPGSACPGQTVIIAGHPDGTPGLNIGNGSAYDDTSGVTMGMGELQALMKWWAATGTWPTRTLRVGLFDAEEEGLYGSYYYAANLLPKGAQGQVVLVANMDQNGMEYPAHPAGTQSTNWGSGFWYTNINSTPIHDFRLYGGGVGPDQAPPQFAANMPAILHFRQALADSVAQAFTDLGAKYGHRVPLENPAEGGRSIPAYSAGDIAKYSPVQDDTMGRTDQQPFVALGIPGYGVLGAYDSDPHDNPTAAPSTAASPIGGALGVPQIAGYDTPRDNLAHLNLMASGTSASGTPTGSVELYRALELPMTWTLDLLARPEYLGAVAAPAGPVAYFEALPTDPAPGTPIAFNGADSARNGATGVRYFWDFGDGATSTSAVTSHAYTQPGWHTARLVVRDAAGHGSGYAEDINVGAVSTASPHPDPCGTMSAADQAQVLTLNHA